MADFLNRYAIFLSIFTISIVVMFMTRRRTDRILEKWARANQVDIIFKSLGLSKSGPFFFTVGHQAVYLLTVRNQHGVEERCWVRLGGFFGLSEKVEAKWEHRDRFAAPPERSRAT